ncbi:MAG: hypothetical protein K6T83_20425, partial [Alicyclobacillus sp.]|nr:hypothetical protein [Alicyclobacillus sp.]
PTLLEMVEVLTDEKRKAEARLEVLERLYEDVKNWRYGLIDKVMGKDIGYIACTYPAIYRLAQTFDELEWMERD